MLAGPADIMMFMRIYGGLAHDQYGQNGSDETGELRGRTVYVLVDLGVARVKIHVILVH